VSAGAIDEKTQQLFENLGNRQPLAAATHGTEESIDLLKNLGVAKIAGKQTQTAAAGERIVGNPDAVNDCFAFCRGRGKSHCQSPTFWVAVARYVMASITSLYHTLSPLGGIFLRLNRSV